jgi:hypothetical protein
MPTFTMLDTDADLVNTIALGPVAGISIEPVSARKTAPTTVAMTLCIPTMAWKMLRFYSNTTAVLPVPLLLQVEIQ